MSFVTPNNGQIVLPSHVGQFSRALGGVEGGGQPIRLTQYSDAVDYANVLGNADTTNGLALKIQYGTTGSPVTIATFAKAGTTITKLLSTSGGSTNYWQYNDSNDEFEGLEYYHGGVRKLLLADRGMIFGPYNEWHNSSQDVTPYGIWEWTYPVDGNNGPKVQVQSLTLCEVVGDPSELNFEYRRQATVGGAARQTLAGSNIGMLVWWGRIADGSDKEKVAQIMGKNFADVTATAHGGYIGLLTAPHGTDTDPIPRLIVAPNGSVIIDNTLASSSDSQWNPTYISGIEELLTVRGSSNPAIGVKSFKTRAGGDHVYYRAMFDSTSTAWGNTNGGFMLDVVIDTASPLKTQADFYVNTGNALTVAGRFDANAVFTSFQGCNLQFGGTNRIQVNTTGIGFFAATPVAQRGAYTQTYSTADRTHANFTSSDLTGISSSTTGSALAEPSAGYVQSEMQQNFRRIQDQFVLLRADLADAKQVINSLIDDSQALGFAT